ncbi:M16 family metallopeptidase [Streptomyces flavofungini]|uniref:Insulinase family protein n=1 Tax=Streptomyces flavofungini TaxID=68200 RepID=A0ABS0WXG2_9ACTN|nr:pitrilysin family protein [Streptomyces flavofungini]MBJ3805622.1 insulinase family protein [Streptomyces flavofungini]GHC72783.1 peptidase M16 [Streptomyces flavofungini]
MHQFTEVEGPIPVVGLIDDRLSTTTICLASKYGSQLDPLGQCGLAHVLEHVLMSTPVGSVPSLSEYVERLGGHANAETGLDRMLFYAQVHPDDADEIAGLLYQAVLQPRWSDAVLKQEKRAVFQELAAAAADHSDVVQDAFLAHFFPGHPMGRPVGGTKVDVERCDTASVAAAHRDRLLTAPLSVIVVGPRLPKSIDPVAAGIEPHTLATIGTAPATVPPSPPPAPPHPVRWSEEFTWLCAGAPSVPDHDPRRPHFNVLAQLLGSSPSSLLYRRLRGEAGLAYTFYAWNRGYADTGAWRVMAGVEPGNGDAALEVIRNALDEVATKGPDPDDLASSRRQARMRVLTSMDTPLDCARFLAMRSAASGSWSSTDEVAYIDAVTADDVQRAAAQIRDGFRAVASPAAP